ncbi:MULTISPECIES: TonB-dependent receptor [unclassified Lentimicrobium]|uniref:TonB-dependent receptor n=1 Tax=unclassified Lentimicrobium TaxID=2677434 RepID=UPI001553F913|nr:MULTISPECIES: TonB-dependent receptor [unclassified Lentimicrobium]
MREDKNKKDFERKPASLLAVFLLIMLAGPSVFAQQFTISGRITDAENGEDLIGATVWESSSSMGTTSNVYGFYSLSIPEGKHSITYSYMGFEAQTIDVDFNGDKTINIKLLPSSNELEEVEVTSERLDENISSTQMSVEKLNMKQIEKIPVFMGEKDILKTIQLLPGISTTSEGGSGFSVRGGSIDQNLILLDEAPVYSASHLMGFFSVFNSDALKNITVYKGGIPANYGGRASSVLDISMKDGNNQKFSASGGIGLISSRLTLEGPIIKDKMSFIVSGRRSYADLVAKSAGFFDDDMNMYFYDLNAKMNYKINDNNRVFISGYFGKDEFGFEDMGMDWGNTTGTLRWNHLFNSKLFSNTSIIYSKYDYGFSMGSDASMSSGIEDIGFKEDLTYYLNPLNTLKFGLNIKHHTFNPGELLYTDSDITEIVLDKTKAYESAAYISNNQKITEKLSAEYGLRFSMFNQMGEGWTNTYNENNEKVDSVYFGDGELMQTYWDIEPRLSLNYQLNESSAIKLSYNRMAQYLHLLSNSTSGQPTDTWVPSSSNIEPQSVSQYALGYFKNFADNKYEFSVETYYKDINNVTDYEDGTDIMLNENIEAYILQGKGRSYGAEFYLKKKYGRFNGWISYTLARTENKIDGINNNNWYPSKIDKTHDLSIVANFEINKRLSISAAWIYYTGNAVTFPSGKYDYDNQIWSYYTERNSYRMPDYHRLDLNLHLKGKEKKRFQSSWDFSLYNAYNRYNAYSITFEESETNPGQTEAVKLSLFGIVPSVTWNFKF